MISDESKKTKIVVLTENIVQLYDAQYYNMLSLNNDKIGNLIEKCKDLKLTFANKKGSLKYNTPIIDTMNLSVATSFNQID